MGLRLKFNLVLLLVFLVGVSAAAFISHKLLRDNAREEVVRNAELILDTALAVRAYTVAQVRPKLESQLAVEFLPQTVPAYAATETLNDLRKKYPDYFYKEATLNPTNPRDRAVDWETDIVQEFRNAPDRKEIVGERDTPSGRALFIARPLQIKAPACLTCHSVPAAAPASMVKLYGESNGFNWKLNEIVGAQVVSVPMSLPIKNANRVFYTFVASLIGVFLVSFIALNLMMSLLILRPISRISSSADKISKGDMNIPEFPEQGKDEISVLTRSFNRMIRSLKKAMQLLEE